MFRRQPMRYSLMFFAVGVAALLLLQQTKAQRPQTTLPGARAEIDAANYASLQKAMDALPTEGGCVRIPAGRFEIAEPLVIEVGDVLFTGQGTASELVNVNQSGKPCLIVRPKNFAAEPKAALWRVQIANLRLTGNEKSGHGIEALRVNELFVDGITVSYHGGDGVRLDHCYEDPRICDSLISYNKQAGLNLLGCHDIVVSSNQFEENQDAVRCIDGFNLCMTGNNVDDHLRHGVVIENTYGSVVSGNMIEECQGAGIVLDRDCYGITLAANVIAHEFAGGIELLDAHGCTVSANSFPLVHQHALLIGPESDRIAVTGNAFADSYIGRGATKRPVKEDPAGGLTLSGTRDVAVSGNTFSGLARPAVALEGAESRRILFHDNLLAGGTSEHDKLIESDVSDNLVDPLADKATERKTYAYKSVGELQIKADVYRLPGDDVRPVIVWIHGGGLITGGRGGPALEQRRRYLDAGYVIVAIDYRLAPETKLPGIIEDVRDAIKWVRGKGPELYRIDPKRVAVVGHSAGGYLTLMAGFAVEPRPQALIAFYGYGPVLEQKLESLRGEFRKVRKTFDNELQKSKAYLSEEVKLGQLDHRQWAGLKTYLAYRGLVESLFDLRVLDPAMGSGHFLVETVDFITDRLLKFRNQFPINPVLFALDRTRTSILESLGEQGVSVDPAKLTDINLLKRHVLKRCVYGVDLNPMAVELAKVSLWLDAFTLGAPLNFLDHHLRCGNALIGATFHDLQAATRSRLFGIDYEPLLRAILHVLKVNKMADATAAEVKQSANEYDLAREELSGYRIVLDLLVAKHFGHPKAPGLLEHGDNLGLTSRGRLMASLDDLQELALVERVEAMARQPDRRFFHWEIEFPEVFFAFSDANERHLKHKNEILAGSAGFDAVVGNPPYVRQETIKPFKDFLKSNYETFDSTNDLYVYFQEQEIRHLRAEGQMGMIVANKWMRAGYGERLRNYLGGTARPLEVVDFGHSPIFPDADTFPCILLASRRGAPLEVGNEPAESEALATCQVPRDEWHDRMDLSAYVARSRYSIPTRLLRREGWSLENPAVQALLEKIRQTTVPLRDFVGATPLMGIKTGFNEAFIVDTGTAQQLIVRSESSRELLRPLVRGRDARRWSPHRSGAMLIHIASSENVNWPWSDKRETEAVKSFKGLYPAIHDHMEQFQDQLRIRQDQGRFWWELRSCAYYDELSGPKLLIQSIAYHSVFCRGRSGELPNNSLFFLPRDELALLAIMNSPLAWSYMYRCFPHKKDEAIALDSAVVATLPSRTSTLSARTKAISSSTSLSVASLKGSASRSPCSRFFKALAFGFSPRSVPDCGFAPSKSRNAPTWCNPSFTKFPQ